MDDLRDQWAYEVEGIIGRIMTKIKELPFMDDRGELPNALRSKLESVYHSLKKAAITLEE